MEYRKAILATTHVDLHNECFALEALEDMVEDGLSELDAILPPYLQNEDIHRVIIEYIDKRLEVKFGVRRDAVPLFPQKTKPEV